MIAADPVTHIRLDAKGVAWIDDTNVKIIEVVLEHLAHGSSPEEIHFQHPHLSLAQIHSAFAYYFDHRAELDAEIKRRSRKVEALRSEAKDQPSRKELLARRQPSFAQRYAAYVGIADDLPADLAANIDHYVHGHRER